MTTPNKPRAEGRALLVGIAGEPVEAVARERGGYGDIVERAVGPAWPGRYEHVDLRGEALPDPRRFAGIVLSGSAASTYERVDWMQRAEGWLLDALGADVPTFGICFGHQLLAQALGGTVAPNPRGREMSTVTISRCAEHPLLEPLPERFAANTCHVDTVTVLPTGAKVLATSAGDDHQALSFAPRAFGVQFHPELDGPMMRAFIEGRRELVLRDGLDPVELTARAADGEHGREVLRIFVRRFVSR